MALTDAKQQGLKDEVILTSFERRTPSHIHVNRLAEEIAGNYILTTRVKKNSDFIETEGNSVELGSTVVAKAPVNITSTACEDNYTLTLEHFRL